jgi:hypothetical protein
MHRWLYYRGDGEVEGETSVPATTPAVTQSQSEAQQALATFWTKVTEEIRKIGNVSTQCHGFYFSKGRMYAVSVWSVYSTAFQFIV